MADPDRVLVPTFGRPREDEALAYAIETFPGADLTLLAVVTPLDAPMSEGGVLERGEDRADEARDRSTRLLESIDDPSATDRVRIDTAEGRPGTVVPRYATEHDVGHVVMCGHERGSANLLRRILGQGVAGTIVERTDRPVTVLD